MLFKCTERNSEGNISLSHLIYCSTCDAFQFQLSNLSLILLKLFIYHLRSCHQVLQFFKLIIYHLLNGRNSWCMLVLVNVANRSGKCLSLCLSAYHLWRFQQPKSIHNIAVLYLKLVQMCWQRLSVFNLSFSNIH